MFKSKKDKLIEDYSKALDKADHNFNILYDKYIRLQSLYDQRVSEINIANERVDIIIRNLKKRGFTDSEISEFGFGDVSNI